jgi:hypothetical protein
MSPVKAKKPKAKKKPRSKARKAPIRTRAAASQAARPFRFTAAQNVQIHFKGEKKPENFRVDDMLEATVATLDGQTQLGFQNRLVSKDKQESDGSDRCFWLFDPKPVGAADAVDPSLWRRLPEQTFEGLEVVASCSGNFSTRSVTSYDGSGTRHVVRLNDKPTYRMRLDLNGKCDFCESLPVTIRKGDALSVDV